MTNKTKRKDVSGHLMKLCIRPPEAKRERLKSCVKIPFLRERYNEEVKREGKEKDKHREHREKKELHGGKIFRYGKNQGKNKWTTPHPPWKGGAVQATFRFTTYFRFFLCASVSSVPLPPGRQVCVHLSLQPPAFLFTSPSEVYILQ
jgi:hypothetical protein